jgi:phospholipase C
MTRYMTMNKLITGLCLAMCLAFIYNPVTLAEDPASTTPIQHVLVLMQENHSFDNYFGTYPKANGIPSNTCMPVDPSNPDKSECIKPFHIGDNDVGTDDPDHSSETALAQYNNGKLDGFVYALNQRNQDGRLSMGYYDDRDLSYYWNVADQYVLFDNFFSSARGGSSENHFFWVAGSIVVENGDTSQEVFAKTPTIFDRLQEKGVSWKFYVQNYDPKLNYRTVTSYPANRASQVIWVPLLYFDRFIDDPNLSSHIVNMDEYFTDLINGTLPQVAYMVPSGPSEHPPSSVRSGENFVKTLIQSLMQSDYWNNSAFMWSYDDWGGWYDHVPPPSIDKDGYGFRVPTLLVSPYARQGYIDSTQLDFTSFLRFIEDNWNLEPLASRDAKANSIVSAFDFSQSLRPAQFIPFDRISESTKVEPRRWVIYVLYGGALLITTVLIVTATIGLPGYHFWRRIRVGGAK